MKKGKLAIVAAFTTLLNFLGTAHAKESAPSYHEESLSSRKSCSEISPLYLHDAVSAVNSNDALCAWGGGHMSHASHASHASHTSHYSARLA